MQFGSHQKKLQDDLTRWLDEGPPLALLEGFPGTGKTELASQIVKTVDQAAPGGDNRKTLWIELTEGSVEAISEKLLLDLAADLEELGLTQPAQDLQEGTLTPATLVRVLRGQRLLVVIDEFQNLVNAAGCLASDSWSKGLSEIRRSDPCRVVLLSSQTLDHSERWLEGAFHRHIDGFEPTEGAALLGSLLEQYGQPDAVPEAMRDRVSQWLGGNPRAIKLMAEELRYEPLNEIIRWEPDAWTLRDGGGSRKFLRRFEERILQRALGRLEDGHMVFLRRLAVLREPARKEMAEALAQSSDDAPTMIRALVDRMLLDFRRTQHQYTMTPVVRHTVLLNSPEAQRRAAHDAAGRYYARPFLAARTLGHPVTLAAKFREARYHFFHAGNADDIRRIADAFSAELIKTWGWTAKLPTDAEERDERIMVLSALLTERGRHSLEYHLTRLLVSRARPEDWQAALPHARRCTGPQSPCDAWLLRMTVERQAVSLQSALKVGYEALAATDNSSAMPLYIEMGRLLEEAKDSNRAMELLHEAKDKIAPEYSLFSIYQLAAEILKRSGKPEEAIMLLREGHERIGEGHNAYKLVEAMIYTSSAHGLPTPKEVLLSRRQALLAEILAVQAAGDWNAAAAIGKAACAEFPTYMPLRCQAAYSILGSGRANEAWILFQQGPFRLDRRYPSFSWLVALVALRAGATVDAAAAWAAYPDSGGKAPDLETLLRSWDASPGTSDAAFHFPFMPPSLTGLDRTLRHGQSGLPVLGQLPILARDQASNNALPDKEPKEKEAAPAAKPTRTALVAATEWTPRHGGISTFNRAFCSTLARETGWTVFCVLPTTPLAAETNDAQKAGVILLRGDLVDHDDFDHSPQPPALPNGRVPDLILGHDLQTGSAALGLRDRFFPKAAFAFFMHTAPSEVEWLKERTAMRQGGATRRHDNRRQRQRQLALNAELILPIGPRLTQDIHMELRPEPAIPPVHMFLPGTTDTPMAKEAPPPIPRLLLFGRTEDPALKGIDLAARAAALVQESMSLPRLQLVVRGGNDTEGDDLRRKLSHIAGSNKLEILVRAYSPEHETVEDEMMSASVVLMPSRAEGFGLSGLEAMALGVPTLITDQSGLADHLEITDSASAKIVRVSTGRSPDTLEKDAATWAEYIRAILRDQASARHGARRIAEGLRQRMTWSNAIKALREQVDDVIDARHKKLPQGLSA